MAQDVDDLEYNEFLLILQKKFPNLYEKAQERSFAICVPHSRHLDGFKMEGFKPSQQLYEKYIFEPSSYFKGEFDSLCKPAIKVRIAEGNLRITHPTMKDFSLKILQEETYYNDSYQAFHIYCMDGTFEKTNPSLASPVSSSAVESLKDKFFQSRSSLQEFEQVLITYASSAANNLDKLAHQFIESYFIVRGYLEELGEKLQGIRDEVLRDAVRSPDLAAVKSDPRLLGILSDAVECCLLNKVLSIEF